LAFVYFPQLVLPIHFGTVTPPSVAVVFSVNE
jgi:hypothetical protein